MGNEYVMGQTSGYIKFGSTVLSSDWRNFEPDETIGLVDASAGTDTARSDKVTLKDGSASIELVAQTGGTAIWTALALGTSGTLEWGEEGTASTKQKHTVLAIVTHRHKAEPFDNLVILTADFKFQEAVTDTVY